MPSVFNPEIARQAIQFQDIGKLDELDHHQLLKTEHGDQQIATFDQVKQVGQLFLRQNFNDVLLSTKPLPECLFARHEQEGKGYFWGKLALRADTESHFPVTVEVIKVPGGHDLRLHIVPIHFGALEKAQFAHHTDSFLALAAAAAVAPQFVLALEGGIITTNCATKREGVTSITPDHGTPLAVTFDAFEGGYSTLTAAIAVTKNQNLSIKQAAHLHGQEKPSTQQISVAAAGSKIAAGVQIRSVLRSQLPKHALYLQTIDDGFGNPSIVSIDESIKMAGIGALDLSLLSTALGFTSRVVGDSDREKTLEKVLKLSNADMPLTEMINS